jgi:hypothetical protein
MGLPSEHYSTPDFRPDHERIVIHPLSRGCRFGSFETGPGMPTGLVPK